MVQLSNLMIAVLVMGICLFALSSSLTSVANNYSVTLTENTTNFINSANSSQSSIMDWANDKQGAVADNEPDSGLQFITSGILYILTSPLFLIDVFTNLIWSFAASVSVATGISVGEISYILYGLITIVTVSVLFAIMSAVLGRQNL